MPKPKRPVTFDHLRKKTPREQTVRIVLNDVAVDALADAKEAVDRARRLAIDGDEERAAALAEAEKEFEAAKEALDAATATMRFRALPGKRKDPSQRPSYADVLRENPPTDEQKAEGLNLPYDPESFPQALVAATCVEPEMTVEQVNDLWETWNAAEVQELYDAAIAVNLQRRSARP